MSRLTDVHVKYLRQNGYDNLKEWMQNPNNIYIGRRGILILNGKRYPEENSIWANPFKVGNDGTLEEILLKYWNYIHERLATEPELFNKLFELDGKNLGCWCCEKYACDYKSMKWCCHGQILCHIIEFNKR